MALARQKDTNTTSKEKNKQAIQNINRTGTVSGKPSGVKSTNVPKYNTDTSNLAGNNRQQALGTPKTYTANKSNVLAGTPAKRETGKTFVPETNLQTNPTTVSKLKQNQSTYSRMTDESTRKANQLVNNVVGAVNNLKNQFIENMSTPTGRIELRANYKANRDQQKFEQVHRENEDRVNSTTQEQFDQMFDSNGNRIDHSEEIKGIENEISQIDSMLDMVQDDSITSVQKTHRDELQKQLDYLNDLDERAQSFEEYYTYKQLEDSGDERLASYKEMLSHKNDNILERAGNALNHLGNTTTNIVPTAFEQMREIGTANYANENIAQLEEMHNSGQIDDATYLESLSQWQDYIDRYKSTNSDSMSQIIRANADRLSANTYYGASDIEKFCLQAGESTAQFLLHFALLGESATISMSLVSGTEKMNQLLMEGVDPQVALQNGFMTGLVSYVTEKIGMDRFVNMMGTPFSSDAMGSIILNQLKGGLSEGLEEVAEGLVDPIIDSYTLGTPYEVNGNELLMEFFLGGASGLLMGIGSTTIGTVQSAIELNNFLNERREVRADVQNRIGELVVNSQYQKNLLRSEVNKLKIHYNSMTEAQKQVARELIAKGESSIQSYENKSQIQGVTFSSDIPAETTEEENNKAIYETYENDFNNELHFEQKLDQTENYLNDLIDSQVAVDTVNYQTQQILNENGYNIDPKVFNSLSPEQQNKSLVALDFARTMGLNVNVVNNLPAGQNGFVDKNGVITIDGTKNPVLFTLTHELTHGTESSKYYPLLKKIVMGNFEGDWEQAKQQKIAEYKEGVNQDLSPEEAEQEIVARYIEDKLGDEQFIDNLIKYNFSLASRIYQNLKSIGSDKEIDQIRNAFEKAFADNYEANREQYSYDIKQLNREYMDAVKNSDMKTAERIVRQVAQEYALATGQQLYEGFHGTNAEFNEFLEEKLGSKNIFAESAKMGYFMAGSKETAEAYTGINEGDTLRLNFSPEMEEARNRIRERYNLEEIEKRDKEARDAFFNQKLEEDVANKNSETAEYISKLREKKSQLVEVLGEDGYNSLLDDARFRWNAEKIGPERESRINVLDWEFEASDAHKELLDAQNKAWADYENEANEFLGYKPNIKHLFAFMENPLVHDFKNKGRDVDFSELMREAKENGNDGCVFLNVQDGGGFDTIYAVFSPNQFKSADPVTYDDNGNVIPLSERFNPNTNDLRYSYAPKKVNQDYMKAVKDGDMEKAQELVDKVAKANGYDIKAYHGTNQKFTKFSNQNTGKNFNNYLRYGTGFYFAPTEEETKRYGKNTMSVYLSADRLLDASKPVENEKAYQYLIDNGFQPGDARFAMNYGDRFINALYDTLLDRYSQGGANAQVQSLLREFGYDGVVAFYGANNDKGEVVVFDPSQIKSADPVTYDDNGNVIPLSQRFDSENDDIRYSYNPESGRFESGNSTVDTLMNNIVDSMSEEEFQNYLKTGEFEYATQDEIEDDPEIQDEGLWLKDPDGEYIKVDDNYKSDGKTVAWKDNRIDALIKTNEEGKLAEGQYKYFYALNLSPNDYRALSFIFEPTHDRIWRNEIQDDYYNNGEVIPERLGDEGSGRLGGNMFFKAESGSRYGTFKIKGQEGNHRAIMLDESGYSKMPIVLATDRPLSSWVRLQGMDNPRAGITNPNEKYFDFKDFTELKSDKRGRLLRKHGSLSNSDVQYSYESGKINKESTDEFRRLQEESESLLNESGWAGEERLRRLQDEGVRQRISGILRAELQSRGYSDSNTDELLKNTGDFKMFKGVDGQTFHDIFNVARAYTEMGELVDLHPVVTEVNDGYENTGYNDTRNFLSTDGMSGFAIKKNGDLISVFNASDKHGFLNSIAPYVKRYAKTLDCYVLDPKITGTNLMELYQKRFGFEVDHMEDYDMTYDHDGIADRYDEPKIAYMYNPRSVKYSYGGPGGLNNLLRNGTEEDIEAYNRAQEQRQKAVDMRSQKNDDGSQKYTEQEILKATGWFVPDYESNKTKDRFEFYDDGLIDALADYVSNEKGLGTNYKDYSIIMSSPKLGDIIKDDHLLFKMYPRLKELPLQIRNRASSTGGGYLDNQYFYINKKSSQGRTLSLNELKDSIAHEIQHHIQYEEGFEYDYKNRNYWKKPGEIESYDAGARQANPSKRTNDVINGKIKSDAEQIHGANTGSGEDLGTADRANESSRPDNDELRGNRRNNGESTTGSSSEETSGKEPLTSNEAEGNLLGSNESNGNDKQIAKILDELPKPETFKDRLDRALRIARHELVDHLDAVEELGRQYKNDKINAKADYAMLANNIAGEFLLNGRRDLDTGKVIGESYYDIVKDLSKETLHDFEEYLYHWRNVDSSTAGDRMGGDYTNKYVFGDSIGEKESQDRIKELETQHPEFKKLGDRMWKFFRQNLEMLVEYGVISQQQMDNYVEATPHYVPIQRNVNKSKTGVGSLDPNKAIRRFKGSNIDILPLEYSAIQNTNNTVRSALTNSLHNEIMDTVGGLTEMDPDTMEQVLDSGFDPLGIGEDGVKRMYAYKDGVKYNMPIEDDLYNSLSPRKNPWNLPNITPVQSMSEFRRNLITGWNPMFMFTNAIKDVQDAIFNTKYLKEFPRAYAEAWAQILTNGEFKQLYLANGGGQNSYFRELGNPKTEAKTPIGKAFNTVVELNEAVEMAPRLAEFIASIKDGKTIPEAMYNASEITTNFKRGGDTAKYINRNGFAFLNASIQGFTKQVRNLRDAKAGGPKAMATYMAKVAILGGLPLAILNGLVWKDDKDYDELSDYVKENYYCVWKLDDGRFLRIPKGRLASFFQTVLQNGADTLQGKTKAWEALLSDYTSFMDNVAPNNPVDNSLLAPLKQAKKNESWYGEAIVPTRLQDVPDSEQYDETTDLLSIELGKLSKKIADATGMDILELSPYKVNYVLDQYSGAIGDIGLPMITNKTDVPIDNKVLKGLASPWLDRFTTDSVLKNKNVSNFYSLKDEVQKLSNSKDATDEQILAYKYMSSVSSAMGKLYAEKRRIQGDTTLTNKEKYEQVREIQKQINDLAKEGLANYDQIDMTGNLATVGGVTYFKGEDGWAKPNKNSLEKLNNANLSEEDKNAYYSTYSSITAIRNDIKSKTPEGQTANYTQATIDAINNSNMSYAGKNTMFDSYYDNKFTNHVNSMDLTDKQKYDLKVAGKLAEGKKDENGKTISNSKAEATAEAYKKLGLLDDVLKYIKDNDIAPSEMGLSKTVYNKLIKSNDYATAYSKSFSSKSKKSSEHKKKTGGSTGIKQAKIGSAQVNVKKDTSKIANKYLSAYRSTFNKNAQATSASYSICPKCHNRVPKGSSRCPICGASL